jgi:RND family efflux transporter MFP subunit
VSDLKGELATLRIDRDGTTRRKGRWLVYAALLLGVGLLGAIALRSRGTFAAVEIATTRPTVSRPGPGSPGLPILTASGYVVPRRKAVVSAKIQGRLADLRVEEGSRVREGEILARLESADYEAQVQRSRATVERALADLGENERQVRLAQQLAHDGIVSNDSLEAAQSRVKIAQAALSQARADESLATAQFNNTIIRAPFGGVVLRKMAEVGESVAPIPPGVNLSTSSGAIVALADLDTLEVEADVSESNVARLGAEQPAVVSVEAFPDKRYRAVLRQIIPTADRTRATVLVKVTILDKDPALKPEMNAKVDFQERPASAAAGADTPAGGSAPPAAPAAPLVTVPAAAVVEREGHAFVFEVADGRVREIPVVTGAGRDGQVVVREGLTGSETLVLRPPATLRSGDAVRIKSS